MTYPVYRLDCLGYIQRVQKRLTHNAEIVAIRLVRKRRSDHSPTLNVSKLPTLYQQNVSASRSISFQPANDL